MLFPSTIAGSLPKPEWLAEPNVLWAPWKAKGEELARAKRDATILALKLQEDSGIDILTEGEQSRQHFVHGFLERVNGIDFAHKVEMGIRKDQGELNILKAISEDTLKLGSGTGKGLLIVDDLVDTGKTAQLVREMLPDAHFATVYAKPKGRPLVDTFITEVSQDTWIFFPWDTALSFAPPLRDGAA